MDTRKRAKKNFPSPSQESPQKARKSFPSSSSRFSRTEDSASQSSSKTDRSFTSLVNGCATYILVSDQKKRPIKKQDILKHVFINQDSKLFNTVLKKASDFLEKTFGLEVLEIINRKNEYILINVLEPSVGETTSVREFVQFAETDRRKMGLIFYLLTIIYMNGNFMKEEDLWKALEPLGIDIKCRTPHPVFGDVRKYLTIELVCQMYLEYKCLSKDPPLYEFEWGERAKQEVRKADLLNFACEIDGSKPSDWHMQYNDAEAKGSAEDE